MRRAQIRETGVAALTQVLSERGWRVHVDLEESDTGVKVRARDSGGAEHGTELVLAIEFADDARLEGLRRELLRPLYPHSVFDSAVVQDGVPVADPIPCWLDVVHARVPVRADEQAAASERGALRKLFARRPRRSRGARGRPSIARWSRFSQSSMDSS